jgi:hypothetical protein
MADPLYLSLWYPDFDVEDMMPRALSVMRQFPFSTEHSGIRYITLHPVSWNEATLLEQRYNPGIPPEQAVLVAADQLHEDYAYTFEAEWDLWIPSPDQKEWTLQPSAVTFLVHGLEFEDGTYQQDGHIEVDFGLETPFVQEEIALTPVVEDRVRANVQKLVDFSAKAEKSSGATGRLLWSESEENLAQKLMSRLQRVQ